MKPQAPYLSETAVRACHGAPGQTRLNALRTLTRLALAAGLLAAAAQAGAAGLVELLELARKNDPQLAAARHALAAGREKQVQGRAQMLPNVNATGSLRGNRDHSSAYAGGRDYTARTLAVQAVQPVLRPANLAAARAGELQAELAQTQWQQAEQEFTLRIIKAYFEVLQADDVLATVGAQTAAFSAQLAQATRGMEVGTVPITDVNEAQARTDLAAAQEIAAKNDAEVKRRVLERAIGGPLPPLARLKDDGVVSAVNAQELHTLASSASTDSLAVRAAQITRDLARVENERHDKANLPTVDLVISHTDTTNANYGVLGGTHNRQVSAGVEVAFPLYQGGAIESRQREALANLARAEEELENARRQALLDAHQAMLGVRSGAALVGALQQARRSSETQLASSRRGLEVGVRTRVDVLNAEQQLHATMRDLAAARYQTLVAAVQLRAAAGQLGEGDARALDALLVP